MPVEIHPISLGFVSVFLLKGGKNVLIDAGYPGHMERLARGLAVSNTELHEIDLLLLTHAHFDHIGLASEIVIPPEWIDGTDSGAAMKNRSIELLESFYPFQLFKRLKRFKPFPLHEQDLFLQFPYASYPLQHRRVRIMKKGI